MSAPTDTKDTTTTTPAPALVAERVVTDPRIHFGVPCYGGQVDWTWVQSVLKLERVTEIIGDMTCVPNDSLVPRARNTLAHEFLRGVLKLDEAGQPVRVLYDWLLFIDTDIGFEPWQVVRLFEHGTQGGMKIVCGMYPMKKLKPQFVMNALPDSLPDPTTDIARVRDAGTGFMLIHRSVFERMIDAYGDEISYHGDDNEGGQLRYDFFGVGPHYDKFAKRRRYLSEDYMFTQRWIELGESVFMDTRIQLKHVGKATFPFTREEFMEALPVYEAMKKVNVAEHLTAAPKENAA